MANANLALMDSAIFRSLRMKGVEEGLALEAARIMQNQVLPDIARQLNKLPFNSLKAGDFRLIQLRNAIQTGMGWDRITGPLTNSLRDIGVDEAAVFFAMLSNYQNLVDFEIYNSNQRNIPFFCKTIQILPIFC